ncbi:hypothetical protein [Streptomyces sp. SAJ15]|uniref:hypothetical protein n=1 Tax=Streptomyces sp. SAJ15 TaxID=2011095 RepID=UPI0011867A5F|nr:hypothetical protein [Streptomyces sp. SAJ15]TVL89716.1 hypothetical protein CD790_25265 [Streptomyces sp. SAJ15]
MPASPGPTPPPPTIDQANAAIRDFMRARSGRALRPAERVEYERLLRLWAEAMRAELTTAA